MERRFCSILATSAEESEAFGGLTGIGGATGIGTTVALRVIGVGLVTGSLSSMPGSGARCWLTQLSPRRHAPTLLRLRSRRRA